MNPPPLPDIQFLIRVGVVAVTAPPAQKQKRPRKTWTQHTRERRARFTAAGKTTRGTERKNKRRPELAGLGHRSHAYRTAWKKIRQAEQNALDNPPAPR